MGVLIPKNTGHQGKIITDTEVESHHTFNFVIVEYNCTHLCDLACSPAAVVLLGPEVGILSYIHTSN